MAHDILDEAYERLHRTGPEFEGWLSNHGPMAAEALIRHGYGDQVHRWIDSYVARLDELPRGINPIEDWRVALGDPKRAGDWLAYFQHQLAEHPWREVLGTWWPRLLPGIAAGATHGVIRVGHAVRALRDGSTPTRITELGQALGYWAARWQPVPGLPSIAPAGTPAPATPLEVDAALDGIPRIEDQTGGIRDRFARLPDVPEWPSAVTALRPPTSPTDTPQLLTEVAYRAGLAYLRYAHGNPVMLVHAVTAPVAVLRTLPELDPALWAPSFTAAWAATAAVTSVYAPTMPAAPATTRVNPAESPGEAFDRAAQHGDEHVVKLADAVIELHTATGDPTVLDAAAHAARLI